MNLAELTDVPTLQVMVSKLWMLLDEIDTLDDVCKSNDDAFRNLTRHVQQKRHEVLTSDGYNLMVRSER